MFKLTFDERSDTLRTYSRLEGLSYHDLTADADRSGREAFRKRLAALFRPRPADRLIPSKTQ